MVDQLNALASEVTRVAHEVGTEGQARRPGRRPRRGRHLEGPAPTTSTRWRATSPTRPATSPRSRPRSRRATCRKKITVDVRGRDSSSSKDTINTMVDQLNAFASEVTRVAREVGTEGKLGGQADVRGVRRHLEGPDRLRQLDGRQPDRPGPQHRRRHDGRRAGRPVQEDHGRRARRDPRAQGHDQHDGRPAQRVRQRGHPGGPRGRHRGQARRPGRRPRRGRHVEGPDRLGQPARGESHDPGPGDRRGGHGRDPRRPVAVRPGPGTGRGRAPQGRRQRDDPQPARDDAAEPGDRLAQDQHRPIRADCCRASAISRWSAA